MKTKTPSSTVLSLRCVYRTPGGRQCRMHASNAHSGLCSQHHILQLREQDADHYPYLSTKFQFFQTAQGINFSLGNLYQLLAQNRISPRRAAVLSYISSLLLRTLPQIDADNAAGIKGPPEDVTAAGTNHSPVSKPALSEGSGSQFHSDSGPASNSHSNKGTESASLSGSAAANSWDPSNPEPVPGKKPS